MPYCTYSETARILGYSSRSTLYKVRRDGWLKHYEVSIEGKKYLDLHPKGHSPLDQHLKGILQWRPSNPIRKMNYMDVYINCLKVRVFDTNQQTNPLMIHISSS